MYQALFILPMSTRQDNIGRHLAAVLELSYMPFVSGLHLCIADCSVASSSRGSFL